jgi:hypothetical protein
LATAPAIPSWIEEGGVDAVEVHVGNARMRIEAAFAPFRVWGAMRLDATV